jgi:hypothetical protein
MTEIDHLPRRKTQRRDTVDCLVAELTDVWKCLNEVPGAINPGSVLDLVYDAQDSLERALQLVSDLRAAGDTTGPWSTSPD